MSGLGMLASAIGGAAGVVGQQAAGDIEQGRKVDIATELANIEVQTRIRVAEAQEMIRQKSEKANFVFANDATNVATRQATRASDIKAESAAVLGAKTAELGNVEYQGAVKKQNDTDAIDAAARARKTSVDNAASTEYLSSLTKITLADPRVVSMLALQRAQAGEASAKAGEANARTGMIGTETAGKKMANANQEKLDGLYDDASKIISDPSITDEVDRAKRFALVQKQIVLMKSKTGQSGVKDPELDTETVKETKINPDGSQSETTRKQVRKPGGIEAKYPEPPQQAIDMLKADPKMAGNFDAIFGKGAAAAAMGSGSAKPTATTKPAAVAAPDAKIEYLRDGYRVNGVKYESIGEAQKASDRIKRGSNNGMSDMIEKFD